MSVSSGETLDVVFVVDTENGIRAMCACAVSLKDKNNEVGVYLMAEKGLKFDYLIKLKNCPDLSSVESVTYAPELRL